MITCGSRWAAVSQALVVQLSLRSENMLRPPAFSMICCGAAVLPDVNGSASPLS
ncbi:Uncharacterised protein [Mycobacteroides abscessus subsp. abscessus]|nr:Uncharacterised protein [Mycobacteroides abscessus subsp. abscessus]SKW03571.1 Uncharacterised protein [Mycobacteroides abscessus subsp. abscessus]